MQKLFTESDATPHGCIAGAFKIETSHGDLLLSELPWQKRGLQETATGYGAKLTSRWKINFCGKLYRVYATCYGNAASCWFTRKGIKYFVS